MKKRLFRASVLMFIFLILSISLVYAFTCPFGDQINTFSDGSSSKTLTFSNGGGSNSQTKIKIPRYNIEITKATVDIQGLSVTQSGEAEIDVIVVTDVSGSMSQSGKLDKAKDADKAFINEVLKNPGSRVGLVSFERYVSSYMSLTTNKNALIDEIDSYHASGTTCISCGLDKAINLLKNSQKDKYILLMSDGKANRCLSGSCDPKSEAISKAREAWEDYGIRVYTVAYGSDADKTTMQKIANAGHGNYYFADTTDIVDVYEDIAIQMTEVYPKNPNLDVGSDGVNEWSYSGDFKTTETVGDFKNSLNNFIPDCNCPGCSISGDFCIIDMKVTSQSAGKIKLFNLDIRYRSTYETDCFDNIDNDCDGLIDQDDPDCWVCGNNYVNPNEECELPGTDNNIYCAQTSSACLGKKLGTRDDFGFCDTTCGCVEDPFIYSCVEGECGAECDSPDDFKVENNVCYFDCDFNELCIFAQNVSMENYCDGSIRYFDATCSPSGVTFQTEDCNALDGYYCVGDSVEQRDYYCTPNGCEYSVVDSEECGPDGWYNYGDTSGFNDPACEYRDYYCQENGLNDYCTFDVIETRDYDNLDGHYCTDNESIEQRDYYCGSNGQAEYEIISGPNSCGEDQWTGGGDTPGFGEDEACIYTDYYCVNNGSQSYCDSDVISIIDYDYLDNDNELCDSFILFSIDYWCDIDSCDSVNIANGCNMSKKLYREGCNIQICGAECESNEDCEDALCNVTYNDYCDGNKLVEYNSNKILDSLTVTNFTENICLEDCVCTNYNVTCEAPPTNTYCVEGVCDAQCDDVSDFKVEGTTCYYGCDPTDTCMYEHFASMENYCDGSVRYFDAECSSSGVTFQTENCDDYDYYEDYEYYCDGNIVKKHRLFHDFSCSPDGCVENVYYTDEQSVENCDDRDGELHNQCGTMDYSCLDGACVITQIIKNDSVCSEPFCIYDIRNYNGYCGDNYYCEYEQEICSQYSGFYCVDNYVEQREYYCTSLACEFTVTNIEQCPPDGWYNYGNTIGLDDPTCEERDYYCQDDGLNDHCTYDIQETRDYDNLDNYYCIDENTWEQRDYYCNATGEPEYEVIQTKNCDDYDYYDEYEYYCEGDSIRKHRLFHDFSCSNGRCVENTYYVDDQFVEDCNDRDGELHNQCGTMDYSCLNGACIVLDIIKNDSLCSNNFCLGDTRNYNGYCGDNYYCEYYQEDCNQYNGFYCVDSYVEQRDYYCTPSSCEYIVTDIEQCQPDGWYNYGNEEGLDDPTCEERDYYCQDNGLNDYCTYDIVDTKDYDNMDGYYCADNESIEQRDYYCGSNGQAEYEIISGPNSCGEDQWSGGGDTPGFGEDEACIYTDYYCTGIGPNSMCLSSVLYTVDFDNMDNTDICIGTKGTKIDYWCNLVTCDYENPLNGCSYGIGTYEMQCSFDCGAECEIDSDCPDSICNVTYQDYCDGRKLVEYNNNMMLDSVTVFNSTPNYCMECCCTCTENPVTCEAPPTNTYCVEGVCDAQCDDVSDFKIDGTTCYYDCDPTDTCMYEHFASMENYCDGSVRYFDAECSPSGVTFQTENCDDYDYYEYRIYCDGSIIKNQTIFHDFSCSPDGCVESIVTSEEIIENCDLMDGTTHNECGVMDYTCSEQNGQAQCVIYQINKNESACSNFCDNGVRNYNGFCNDEYFCEYATENCESYDRVDEPEYYCDGSVVKSRQLFHDFSCTPNECEESTYYVNETVVEDCDDRDGELYHECGLTDWSCSLGACELVGIVKDDSKCSTNFCSGNTRYYNGFCDQNYYCQYSTENCNAFDRYDSFVTYCRGNELWQHRLFHDFSCTPNECVEVSSEYVDDQFLEDCKENPDGWYNYGNDPCFEDPICEYRVYYCMENDNGAVCTYDVTQSHNYNVKDGYYCADSKRIERRDYYCGKGGEEKYAVVEGPTSCGEDGWTGGGNIPGFGDDPACVFITNRCVPNSNNSYCDSTTSYSVDFDSKDEITCKGSKQGEHDFWCDISTCNVMHPSSGCSYGDTWYNLVCSFNCGAECEKDSDCSPHLENDTCYYNGQCTDMCACDYMIETCPEPGTVQNNICYYGTRACGENGCVINSCELEEGEICDAQYGCLSCTDIGTVADKFSDGSYSKNITFNDGGINSSAKVLLPRNVTITGASIDVTGYPAYFSSKNVVAAVLVTDVSSSMQGEKLAKAKEADLEFVNLLLQNNGGNEIGLVSFSTKVTSYLELTNNQTELSNEIDSYYGNGFTCVSCGIKKATELLAEGSNQNKVMILMSDGVINRCIGGTTCFGGKQAIRKAMEAYENYGIKIYTISYGSDADYETMMKIANVTGGKHYFADENSIVDIYRLIAISISKTYPSNIVFNFGDIGTPEWEHSDYLNSTVHISDFQDNINDFLKDCDCPGCEIFDGYCNVYLTFSSETSGTLLLENLNITACSYYVPDGVQCFTCSDCGGGEDCTDYSEWSQWECDWSDVCDESATCQRTRTVRQYTCNNPGVGSYCTSTETVQTDTQIQTRNTDGTSCDDGQYCTINDQCLGGQCVGTEQRTCDDQNPCTDDYCDENLDECVFVPDDTNECGIFRICPEDGCVGLNWTIYPPSGHDYCLAGECIEYSCEPISSVYNPICEPDSDGDGIKDSEDACPDVYGTDCNGCPNPCQGCAVMICPQNGEPTCEADDTQCEPTQCPEDGCGLGSCRPYEWADYPDYVDNTCILNGNIGTCTQNTCDGLETCVYSEACVPQENVSNHVLLSEVFYDTPGSDQYEEWIELYNPTDKVVDISGWKIQDNSGSYVVPQNTVIFPNDTLVIAKDTEGFRNLYGFDPDVAGMSLNLNNNGDILRLINNSGEVDMVAWENEITGWDLVANTNESIERVPINVDTDSPSDWTSHATPKPDTAKTKLNLTNFTIHLYKGINIISIPLSLENNSIEYVLSSIEGSYDVIRTYENGSWKTYDPNFPEISDLMKIIPGKGYIIFMNSDADLTIQGFEILTSTEIQLSTGWNLIGYPKLEIRNVENVLTPIEGKYAEIKTYNPIDGWRSYHSAHPETATLTMMSPGTGYWVYMNEDNILKIERII